MPEVVLPDRGEEGVEQPAVVAVDERPQDGDHDHGQHHRDEEGDPVPAGALALHRHQAGEREPDGNLEHQGRRDVDEGVDVRRSVDVVLERSGEVVEADEL